MAEKDDNDGIQTFVADTGTRRDEDYLGDGVYVSHDDCQFWLRTERENGWHEIALDESMIKKLVEYSKRDFRR